MNEERLCLPDVRGRRPVASRAADPQGATHPFDGKSKMGRRRFDK